LAQTARHPRVEVVQDRGVPAVAVTSTRATLDRQPRRRVGNTVYTPLVAKVMISIPDDLLARIDAQVSALNETRSGFLQRLAERELEAVDARNREEIERLLDQIRIDLRPDDPRVDVARLIREDRESH
jgi:hypothetical protein